MNKIIFPLTAVALCFTAQQAMAATATSGNANAKAKIIAPLTITALTGTGNDLNFGTMLAGTNTVTVAAANSKRSATNGDLLVNDSNTPSAGKFTIGNTTGADVAGTLVLPPSVTISNGNGGTMTVSNFVSSPAAGSQTIGTGDTNVLVGADLAVANNQATGDYTGTYTITVNY